MLFFFFNDTATTEIYTLSLHDALPIFITTHPCRSLFPPTTMMPGCQARRTRRKGYSPDCVEEEDRKSTRLNSSHANISYAVFCLKKKKNMILNTTNHTTSNIRTSETTA